MPLENKPLSDEGRRLWCSPQALTRRLQARARARRLRDFIKHFASFSLSHSLRESNNVRSRSVHYKWLRRLIKLILRVSTLVQVVLD